MKLQAPPAAQLLDIWEQGRNQPPVWRALALLNAACMDSDPNRLADLSIGQRDGYLLRLRELLFGAQLAGVAACPACGERLELNFRVGEIALASTETELVAATAQHSLTTAGYTVDFRLPTSQDLLALTTVPATHEPARALLERCIVQVHCDGQPCTSAELSAEVTGAIIAQMALIDAQADIQLDLTCPACKHRWLVAFDILAYLWSEIDDWAQRILHEIHLLAATYGWPEATILALTPWRRQYYLNLICG